MIRHDLGWFTTEEGEALLNKSATWPLEQPTVIVWDKPHKVPRLTCWFTDGDSGYQYSGQVAKPHRWPPEIFAIKTRIEDELGTKLQHCLVNFYRSCDHTVGWHSDDDHIFGPNPTIASLSCGATRKFKMRHKSDRSQKLEFELSHGDLLVFTDDYVLDWQHTIPRTAKAVGARLNLTFRSGK